MKTSHRRSILLFLLFAVAALVQKCIHSLQDFKVHKKSRVESVVLFFIFFYSSLLNIVRIMSLRFKKMVTRRVQAQMVSPRKHSTT